MPRQKKAASSAKRQPKVASEIAFIEPPAPGEVEIPEQKEHYQLPARFGAPPVWAGGCVMAVEGYDWGGQASIYSRPRHKTGQIQLI
jgi:hypothetical protein